ncbi:MAG: hypothetical protein ACHQ50_06850, partial [Fimbriimonadales bacterium]
ALNAGVKTTRVDPAATTPLIYDSVNLARNASDLVGSLPNPGRHHGHNNLCFADGHVAVRVTPMANR